MFATKSRQTRTQYNNFPDLVVWTKLKMTIATIKFNKLRLSTFYTMILNHRNLHVNSISVEINGEVSASQPPSPSTMVCNFLSFWPLKRPQIEVCPPPRHPPWLSKNSCEAAPSSLRSCLRYSYFDNTAHCSQTHNYRWMCWRHLDRFRHSDTSRRHSHWYLLQSIDKQHLKLLKSCKSLTNQMALRDVPSQCWPL